MSEIRVLVQSSQEGLADEVPALLDKARAVRKEAGCLQYELFRGTEFPENFALLQLWESEAAFDAHWRGQLEQGATLLGDTKQLQAPYHFGSPQSPRRHGLNGIEFSRRVVTQGMDNIWLPRDESLRFETVRWPATLPVRFIWQGTSDPASLGQPQAYYDETRAEEGTLQFEAFRSVEFPENSLELDLWDSPQSFDKHWLLRIAQRMYPELLGGRYTLPGGGPRSGPRVPPPTRRYGETGSEWSQTTWYALTDGVWQPEDPTLRSLTIRWAT